MKVVHSTILGSYVFENNNMLAKVAFDMEQSLKFNKMLQEGTELPTEKKLKEQYRAKTADKQQQARIRKALSTEEYNKQLSIVCKRLTENALQNSITPDMILINVINNIEELQRITNTLTKRLREWYSTYLPEAAHQIQDNEAFVRTSRKPKSEIMKELGLKESIGADLEKKDIDVMHDMAETILDIYDQRTRLEIYLEKLMQDRFRNINAVAGSLIGARLIREAGSLARLARSTSTTVQVLGAEKALFRHLRNKSIPPPKHGHIINHPIVLKCKKNDKGRAARALADKLSMAAKMDYFKGKFIGDKLRKELEVKFS